MYRTANHRSLASEPLPDLVRSVLEAHAAKKVASRLLGSTAEVLSAIEETPAELAKRVAEAARPGPSQAVGDILAWEGGEYLLHLEELPDSRTAIEIYRLRGSGAPKPGDLLALLFGDAGGRHTPDGEDFAWLDRASEAALAERLAPARVPAAFREDIAKVLRPPELRQALAQVRQAPLLLQQPRRDLDILEFSGLVRKQFALVCAKAPEQPLFTLPEEPKLRLLLDAGARCPRCDEAFSDANIRLAYSITEAGAESVAEPLWVVQPVVALLQRLGARVQPLPVTRSGVTLGAIAFCAGHVVAFAAYDRDMVPADATRLAAACQEVGADRIAVVTTGTATPEAKARLAELTSAGAQADTPRPQFFESFSPAEPDALRGWWSTLADERLSRHLATRGFAPLRRLGLQPPALADALLRQAQGSREVSVTATPVRRENANTRPAKVVKS